MSKAAAGRIAGRLAIAVMLFAAWLPCTVAHEGGTTAFARITVSGQTVRYSLSIPDIANRKLATALPDAAAQAGPHEALAQAVRERVRLSGDATACAAGPAQVVAGSAVSVSVTITIDFACPSTMRALAIRDDTFDVLGHDLHILARVEHDGATETFALATENREARVDVGSRGDSSRGATGFFVLGIEHILTGYDHLLFLLALLIGGGSAWALVKIVTAFTLAHSLTLTAAALDLVVLPGRLVESAIALSIAYVAIENLFVREGRRSKRWWVALVFGLVHGFGFSAVLKDLGLPPNGLAWSLLLFNLGVEAGQALVIAAAMPLLIGLQRAAWRQHALAVMSWAVLAVGVVLFVERAFLS
jgi:hydrogenase/urease accessory protein HupE